jgi:serine/threonine-protein phosphatase 2A regulatory subunit A
VRSSVLLKLPNFVKHISKQKLISNIIPILSDHISSNINNHVKNIFAASVIQCCKELSDDFFEKYLANIISNIFKDDIYETKLGALENFENLSKFVSNQNIMLNTLLPIMNTLSKDNKWRIRLTLAEKINQMYDLCKKNEYISYFLPMIKSFYNDNASQISEVSNVILYKLCKDNDERFIKEHVWEIIRSALYSNSYIIRISGIHSIDYLKEILGNNFMNNDVLPFISLLTSDKVPNVKFTLAKLYKSVLIYLSQSMSKNDKFLAILQDAKMTLNKFKEDRDCDVKFFAEEALLDLNKLK